MPVLTDNNMLECFEQYDQNLSEEDAFNFMLQYDKIKHSQYDITTKIIPLTISTTLKTSTSNDACRKCKTNKYLIEDIKNGILVCSKCGIVLSEIIDESAEWRNYDGESNGNARASGVVNHFLPMTSMKTSISGTKKSFLKTANTWSSNYYSEKKILKIMNFIQKICDENNLTKCIFDDTIILYCKLSSVKYIYGKKINKKIIMRGSKKIGFIAACLGQACIMNKKNKVNKDIAKMFDSKLKLVTTKTVTEGRKRFLNLLNIMGLDIDTKTSITINYIKTFCEKLDIYEEEYVEKSMKISNNMQKIEFMSNHKPISLAASIVYVIVNKVKKHKLTKKLVSLKLDISEVTLNKLSHIIESKYDKLVNDEYINKQKQYAEDYKKNMKIPEKLLTTYQQLKLANPKMFAEFEK